LLGLHAFRKLFLPLAFKMNDDKLLAKTTPGPKQRVSSFWRSHWTFAFLVAVTFLGIISLQSLYNIRSHSSAFAFQDCGSTPAEARSRGCIFDRINYGWTPPACFDAELEDSVYREAMKKDGLWRWSIDKNFTQELAQDWDLLSNHQHVWSDHRYHVVHCLYTWRVLHRAAIRDSLVYSFIGNYGHTTHCSAMMEMAATSRDVPTLVEIKMVFSGCMGLVASG